ncbi:MAG TPA: acyclic terpene utilization AtuA family protein, partial [Gemmataceae bacterium]|nr:acyclic terpene utilization AtuA family protein [Gemmataceae bacterium]
MSGVRIGNGCGFWGDNLDAPILLARDGRLDYLTLEYLAELTMSILALQKQRDPQAGYATDFLDVLDRLTPILQAQPQLKIVTNAGGMNPAACAAKARAILDKAGLANRKIATVSGDDLLPRLDAILAAGQNLANQDTGEPLTSVRQRVVSANAYLGAHPIADALNLGAAIVITGRVADASLTLGPAVHALGWQWNDWDRLAAGSVAGHVIECGAQATGGLWCNWRDCPDLANVGYPIAEMNEGGSFAVSKPPNSGGAVNIETISEQLLYEVGDPAAYMTPDVVADFTSVQLKQTGQDEVRIDKVRGKPATNTYKVSISYRDGFMASGTLVLLGPDAVAKARLCGQMILDRLKRAGFTLDRSNIEVLGAGAVAPGVIATAGAPAEVVLRVSVHDSRKAAVERFSKEFAPLVTSGTPGVTGYTTGRPPVREVFAYWPALIAKNLVQAEVRVEP